jgi:HTH-type transcriptional regulator / antitoxin HigA
VTRTATPSRKVRPASEDYLALVTELPIRPITTAAEYAAAQAILDRLIGRSDLTTGQRDYLAAIVRFVADYEQLKWPIDSEKMSPLEALSFLMEENEMSTTDLGYVVGSRGLASEILNGKRGLCKMVIGRLAHRFKVNPSVFLETLNDTKEGAR